MRPSTIELINAILKNELNSLNGTILHLDHQIGLPAELRVIDLPNDTIEEQLEELRELYNKVGTAAEEFFNHTSI